MSKQKIVIINKYESNQHECREDDNSGCPSFVDKEDVKNDKKIGIYQKKQEKSRPE